MVLRVFLQLSDAAVQRSLGEQLAGRGHILAEGPLMADLLLIEAGEDDSAERCAGFRRDGFLRTLILLGLSPAAARAAGADDGMEKPFRFGDLLKRLETAALREVLAVGRFRLDVAARELSDGGGVTAKLTEKETAILAYLARAGEQPVGRDRLLGEVWGYSCEATTHTVETHIYRLRRKLADMVGDELLKTESGGYRLSF